MGALARAGPRAAIAGSVTAQRSSRGAGWSTGHSNVVGGHEPELRRDERSSCMYEHGRGIYCSGMSKTPARFEKDSFIGL